MCGLRSFSEHGLFQLDEVANPCAVADVDRRPQVGERTDRRVIGDDGIVDHAVIQNGHAIADAGVDQARAAMNFAAGSDGRGAFERNSRMNDRVGADRDVAVDVHGCRIFERHSRCHQRAIFLVSHDATHCRKLGAAVDAENFVGTGNDNRFDRPPLPAVNRHQVGQVVLALCILGGDAANRVEQPVERERVNAGVDFLNRTFGRAGILLLNNTCNLLAGPNDSPVAMRVVDDGADDGCGCPTLSMAI